MNWLCRELTGGHELHRRCIITPSGREPVSAHLFEGEAPSPSDALHLPPLPEGEAREKQLSKKDISWLSLWESCHGVTERVSIWESCHEVTERAISLTTVY